MSKSQLNRSTRSFKSDQSGAVILYTAFMMAVLMVFCSLALNFGHRQFMLSKMQSTADMAALAGASKIPTLNDVRSRANEYAERNMPAGKYQDVLADSDIVLGNWDPVQTPKFSTSRTPLNSVRVIVRRSSANSNQHRNVMTGVLGTPARTDLETIAIAWATTLGNNCYTDGYVAKGENAQIESGSQNTYIGFCLHGQDGVKVGSQNDFDCDSEVSMLDVSTMVEGSDNDGLHTPTCPAGSVPGYSKVVREQDYPPVAAEQIDSVLSGFSSYPPTGEFSIDHFGFTSSSTVSEIKPEDTLLSGTYYIVNGDAELGGGSAGNELVLTNIGIYATGLIKIDSNVILQNVFLAADDKIEMGSNIQLGAIPYGVEEDPILPSSCTATMSPVFMAAKNMIKMGSNLSMHGVQGISGDVYEVGSENKIHGKVGIQAKGEIKYGSEEQYQGCNTTDNAHIVVPLGGEKLQLVY